jgi:hypothetical protein
MLILIISIIQAIKYFITKDDYSPHENSQLDGSFVSYFKAMYLIYNQIHCPVDSYIYNMNYK